MLSLHAGLLIVLEVENAFFSCRLKLDASKAKPSFRGNEVRERDVKHRGVAETAGHLGLLLLSASVRKMSNLRQTAHAQQLGCRQESVYLQTRGPCESPCTSLGY